MMKQAGLWLLCGLFVGCRPVVDTGEEGSKILTVDPKGGLFVRSGVAFDFPEGAVNAPTQITVTVVDSLVPEVPGRKRISFGFRLSPSTLSFSKPVKVGLPWIDDRIPQAVDSATFDMRRQGGPDAYLELPDVKPDPVRQWVQAQTDRLGLFWLTSPAQADVGNLTITPDRSVIRVGDTLTLSAQAVDASGAPLSLNVSWSAVPPRAAEISSSGLLTAKGPGRVTVTAEVDGLSTSAEVWVQGNTVGPETFVFDNPLPTGNDLLGGIRFSDATVLVGANATVLSQNDATGPWNRVASAPAVTLRAVSGLSPTQAVAVGVSGTTGVLVELGTGTPRVSQHPTVEPRAVWFDGTFGMAVGSGNDVLLRRNGTWTKEFSPSFETLLAVTGDGTGRFTTLGNRGSLYRYEPGTQTWESLFQAQLSVLLTGAAFVDGQGQAAWAIGGNKLWHFHQGAWTALNLPVSPALTELTAVGVLDSVILVGGKAGARGYLLSYNPVAPQWSSTPLRGPQVIRGIFGQADEAWAVGDTGTLWKYDAGNVTELSSGFYSDVADLALTPNEVIAAVNDCVDEACSSRLGRIVVRGVAGQWVEAGPRPFSGPVFSVAARSATDIVAGGEGELYHYNGTQWMPVPLLGGQSIVVRDLQFCEDVLYAVSQGGFVFRGTTASVTSLPSFTTRNLHALHCPTGTELWMAGDNALFEKTGRSSFVSRTTSGINHSLWRNVWSPGFGEAFAFGDARYGVYWNTRELIVFETPGGIVPDVITGLWGSSVDNLYAVGHTLLPTPFGFATRFDGAQWTLIDAGAHRKVTALSGKGPTHIWLGTEKGGLLRAVAP